MHRAAGDRRRRPGESRPVRPAVHTGKGSKSAGYLYMGRSWYVWNNDKDKASLYRPTGSLRDSCSYNSTRVDHKMC